MKKIAAIVLVLALLATTSIIALAQATPLTEKNNDKFQTFEVTGSFSMGTVFLGDHQYIPSAEKPNKLVINNDETMLTYDLTVDGQTYKLGKDFTYSGHVTWTFFDPVMTNPYYPSSYREIHEIVDYTYDFSAVPGGIEGTMNLQAISNAGGIYINSQSGTGDLQNVQIKAQVTGSSGGQTPPYYILIIYHAGLVSDWPATPPAP